MQETKPTVFEYTNYRSYLADYLVYLQKKNPAYSAAAFVRSVGFSENSRGYLNLILNGKRNLSPSAILGFAKVLKLSEKETFYFENLTHFNQAQDPKEKAIYFERLEKAMKTNRQATPRAFELLKSHYSYLTKWYLVAIRELVALSNFCEDPDWISKKLKNKVSKKEVTEALEDLFNLKLIERTPENKIQQTNEVLYFSDDLSNHATVKNLQAQFIQRSLESLEEDSYENRSISNSVIGTNKQNIGAIREEIREFRRHLIEKYGTHQENIDCVLSLGFQAVSLTNDEPQKNITTQNKKELT